MKAIKKWLAALVAASLVCAAALAVDVPAVKAATATSIKVRNGKKQKLPVGDSIKIVLRVSPKEASKNISYTSNAKKIAKVSSKGVIKAKSPGTATIAIKAKGGTAKASVKVSVLPAKVKSVSVSIAPGSDSSVTVNWKKQKNVTGYQILRSVKKNKGFKVEKTVKGAAKTSAVLDNVPGGVQYFKVRAYKKAGKKTLNGEQSAAASIKLWQLVWSDEFNGTSLNTANWSYETGANGWGNQEAQNYTPGQNIEFKNGSLVIVPRITVDSSGKIKNATSTRITTAGKKSFCYGKMEIRAKATKAQGTWSAGWMLGSNYQTVTWPDCGEIDIVEAMMGHVPQTIHCHYFNNQSWSHGNKNYELPLTQAQAAADYHTYGILWTDSYIQFTLDGQNHGLYDPSKYSSSIRDQTWTTVFDHPFHFILNCAIGGNAAGQLPSGSYQALENAGWKFESESGGLRTYRDEFAIDYVRVYQ